MVGRNRVVVDETKLNQLFRKLAVADRNRIGNATGFQIQLTKWIIYLRAADIMGVH